MTERPLPSDHLARARSLDPERSFIVQAPAGSGKTELLTRRYLRLLARVDAPEEILAITFTRKAAAEMRNRVLEALALAQADSPPEQPHRFETWTIAREALAADELHDWQIDKHPARLRIQTIDAFNQSLARRLPILSGTGSPLAIARDPQALYAEAIQRVVERLAGADAAADAVARLVRHLDNQLDVMQGLLAGLLAKRDHWLDLGLAHGALNRSALRGHLEQALELAVNERLARLSRLLPPEEHATIAMLGARAAANLLREGSASPITTLCNLSQSLPPTSADRLTEWRAIASLLLTAAGEWRSPRGVNKNLGFPPGETLAKAEFAALLERLGPRAGLAHDLAEVRLLPPARYTEQQWALLDALLDVLRLTVAELELVFRGRGEADYVAAALAARKSLGSVDMPTDLALRLDYRLKHLLVDEFQDTSRGQVELLRLLTAGWVRGDGRTLFCVGDPMQSIYRFREADVGLFLTLRQSGLNDIELEPLGLSVNFRSTRSIVDWVNRIFAGMLPAVDDAERGAVSFTACEAREDSPDSRGVLVHTLAGSAAERRLAEGQLVADLAEAALAARPAGKVAILVSSRNHLPAIIRALDRRGLSYQALEIDPLAERPVVQDLLALTRALVHPGDRTAWLSVLRSPPCGLTLTDLHALTGDSPESVVWNLMHDEQRLAGLSGDGLLRLRRVCGVLEAALATRGRHTLRDWVERTWNSLGGPAALGDEGDLDDAEAYLQRLELIERAGDLEDVTGLEHELDQLYARPVSAATGSRLEIMTVHRAKGLEFDTVILPGLDRTPRHDDPPLLRWFERPRVAPGPRLILAPIAAQGAEADPIYAWLGSIERERSRFERDRQLYVAATRAIGELHLVGGVELTESEDGPKVKPPHPDSFLASLWPAVGRQFVAATVASNVPTAASDSGRGYVELRRLPITWRVPVADAGVGGAAPVQLVGGELLRPHFDWASEASRHIGTLVHRELEQITRRDLESIRSDSWRARRGRFLAELAELGVPPEHREPAVERIITALERTLRDERGRWLLAGTSLHREADSEFALSGFLGAELVNAVIDRTLLDASGTRWVIDFKTSSHEGGGLEDFLANEAERYRPQLARYAGLMRAWRPHETVRAALYFPLLGAWREVEV